MRSWILSYALLAPNPHNRQPWIADLRTEGQIALRLDTERLLPATDPFGRQILMGAGTFLELLLMAAVERGYRAEVRLFPDGVPGEKLDAKDFARVQLTREEGIAQSRRGQTGGRIGGTGKRGGPLRIQRHAEIAAQIARLVRQQPLNAGSLLADATTHRLRKSGPRDRRGQSAGRSLSGAARCFAAFRIVLRSVSVNVQKSPGNVRRFGTLPE